MIKRLLIVVYLKIITILPKVICHVIFLDYGNGNTYNDDQYHDRNFGEI